jgi:hypothetical protein
LNAERTQTLLVSNNTHFRALAIFGVTLEFSQVKLHVFAVTLLKHTAILLHLALEWIRLCLGLVAALAAISIRRRDAIFNAIHALINFSVGQLYRTLKGAERSGSSSECQRAQLVAFRIVTNATLLGLGAELPSVCLTPALALEYLIGDWLMTAHVATFDTAAVALVSSSLD